MKKIILNDIHSSKIIDTPVPLFPRSGTCWKAIGELLNKHSCTGEISNSGKVDRLSSGKKIVTKGVKQTI